MSDFLTLLQTKLNARIAERNKAKEEMDAILAAPAAEQRDALTADETVAFTEKRDAVTAADKEISEIEARVAELEAIETRQAEMRKIHKAAARVTSEARTYSKEAERRDGVSFLADVAGVHGVGLFVPGAADRVARHMQEERVERGAGMESRAIGTSAVASLVVPQYLVDMYAPVASSGRPLANICNRHDLPDAGMTVELSRITTGTSTAVQSSQNSAVSETNMDDTALSISVQSNAGQQTVSRQALERGSGIEGVVLKDLFRAYNTTLDSTLITQATNGLDAITDGNVDVAYTDLSPTVAELWPKIFDVVQQCQTAIGEQAQVNALLMHSRRFWWIASQVGTSFPFVNLIGASGQTGGSVATTQYGAGPAGYLAGLPVYLDNNITTVGGAGTNEDRIYALATDECHLWEDPNAPVFIRAEQTNAASLGVLFVVYGYFAYTFGRFPSANGRIAGTGLVTPSF